MRQSFSSGTANQEGLPFPHPTRPNELRYLFSALAVVLVIGGYAILEPSCKFLSLRGACDTSTTNFATGLTIMVLGTILWMAVWVNSARRVWKMGPKRESV